MNRKITFWIFAFALLVGSLAILFAPLIAAGQSLETIGVQGEKSLSEDGTAQMIKAMFFQVLNRPASLLVIVGLSILAMMAEIIKVCPSDPVKVIMPFCILGGAFFYWLFASTSGVDKSFPYPHAVLAVNGLICGFVSFIVHLFLVKFIQSRINKKD